MEASVFWVRLLATPMLLMVLTWYGTRRGAQSAGVWAAFPVVTGPILGILAFQHGPGFVVSLLDFTLPAVLANLAFGVAFAWAASSRQPGWGPAGYCLFLGLACYAAVSALIVAVAPPLHWSLLMVATGLAVAPYLYPRLIAVERPLATLPRHMYWHKAGVGAVVVVLATYGAELLGNRWGGVLAMFPAMASVMSTYYHGRNGQVSIRFLRGMPIGYWSFAVFCLSLQKLLLVLGSYGKSGVGLSFAGAVLLALGVQWLLLALAKRGERP